MKVAITAQGASWDAAVDPRFGRARTFVLVDTESRDLVEIPNTQALDAAQGAGVQAAALVCRAGAEVIVTGHCGPKAFAALAAGRVRVFTGAEGTVADAVAMLAAGSLKEADGADVAGHWA
jgi:predicted Fe-Mo cluster-binding NifX family protein